jgi:hypothetical protein
MSDDIDFETLFQGLNKNQVLEVVEALKKKPKKETASNIDPAVFEKLGNFPKWNPGDGPAPYVFADRPAGHRCAWACNWIAATPGVPLTVTPADWGLADPGRMTEAQLVAELEDNFFDLLIAAQPFGGVGMEHQFSATMNIRLELLNGANHLIQTLLKGYRENYGRNRNYINPLNIPVGKLVRSPRRPGWA